MKLLLGNYGGTFCNTQKYLLWCLVKKEEDTILFFYANKSDNNHPNMRPFDPNKFYTHEEQNRNIFYKFFEYPQGMNKTDILKLDVFEMNYPCFLDKSTYDKYGLKQFPESFSLHENNFIFTTKLFSDPNIQLYRNLFNSLWKEYLIPTPYLQDRIDSTLKCVTDLQKQGKRILATFIRTPWHFTHTEKKGYEFDDLLDEIIEEMKDYDYLLPITQVGPYYNILQETFPTNMIKLDRIRLPEMADWAHQNLNDLQFEDEVKTAIIDVYLASHCDTVAGGLSNLFISTLLLNPEIKFKIFKCLEGKDSC
jgi:hypothetical protein